MFPYHKIVTFSRLRSEPDSSCVISEARSEHELQAAVTERPISASYVNHTLLLAFGQKGWDHYALLDWAQSQMEFRLKPDWYGGGFWYHERMVGDDYGEFKIYNSPRCRLDPIAEEVRSRALHFLNLNTFDSFDEVVFSGWYPGLQASLAQARTQAKRMGHVLGGFNFEIQRVSTVIKARAECLNCGANAFSQDITTAPIRFLGAAFSNRCNIDRPLSGADP
jgi:hypothetical protein